MRVSDDQPVLNGGATPDTVVPGTNGTHATMVWHFNELSLPHCGEFYYVIQVFAYDGVSSHFTPLLTDISEVVRIVED